MELRKIQFTGGASYTVTLPKDWVEGAKLKAGDVVGLIPLPDGTLGVTPHARGASVGARHEIPVSDEPAEAVFRRIVSAYLSGFDVIVVRSKKPMTGAVRGAVRKAAKRIIGLEIVDEDATTMALQDFLDPREFHIDKGLHRMEALTKAMQQEAVRVLLDPTLDLEESFQERDDEVDRLHWMVNKQYHALLRDPSYAQKMGLNANQALSYLLVARLVERTADHAYRIATNLRALREEELKRKLENRLEGQAKTAFRLFQDALTAFHKQDPVGADRAIEEAARFEETQEAVIEESFSLGGEGILHVAYALESIGRTAAYSSDIAEVAINHVVAMRAEPPKR